jgi:hypothetical protein
MFAARTFLFKQVLVKKRAEGSGDGQSVIAPFASKACLVPMAGSEDIAFNAFRQAATTMCLLMYILRALDITILTTERRLV